MMAVWQRPKPCPRRVAEAKPLRFLKMKKAYVNNNGAAYLAVNALGWAVAPSPWEAIAKLDLRGPNGAGVRFGSSKWDSASAAVSLFYLPNEEEFAGLEWYAPVDADGKPYGVPLYCGDHNAALVKARLEKSA
jgi:hypothetical protein